MLVDIPEEEFKGQSWGRARYLKKSPPIEWPRLLEEVQKVYNMGTHISRMIAALVAYQFCFGARLGECTNYKYNGKWKKKLAPIKFKSPPVSSLVFREVNNQEWLIGIVRREKSKQMRRRDFALLANDETQFLKLKRISLEPEFQETKILLSLDNVMSPYGHFALIIWKYIEYLEHDYYKVQTEIDRLKFNQMSLFPISHQSGRYWIPKYFGVNSHLMRSLSATMFARDLRGNIFEMMKKFNWKHPHVANLYVKGSEFDVMARQIEYMQNKAADRKNDEQFEDNKI